MRPIIFPRTATSFDGLGKGRLECLSCEVDETINGAFDLTCQCAEDAQHLHELECGDILLAKHGSAGDLQAFRVYKISAPLLKTVTVYAHHISYDLAKVTVTPFFASTASEAMASLTANAVTPTPFTFSADAGFDGAAFELEVPVSVRAALVSGDGSAISVFGGEMEWNNFSAALRRQRGRDAGVEIRRGKNLVSLENDRTLNGFSAVVPFYADGEGTIVYASSRVVSIDGDTSCAAPLDLSNEFDYTPSPGQLESAAIAWLTKNRPWDISRALKASALFEENERLQSVAIGDTLTVIDEEAGVSDKFRVLRTVFDALTERYTSVTLGHIPEDVAGVLLKQEAILRKQIDSARAAASQIANGTYTGGTFLDGDIIYAPRIYGGAELHVGANPDAPNGYNFTVQPTGDLISYGGIKLHGDTAIDAPKIRADSFSVFPADIQEAEYPAQIPQGFNLFGRFNGALYHFLQINYYDALSAPVVRIASPASGYLFIGRTGGVTRFEGNVDFSLASVSGLENSGYVKSPDAQQTIADASAENGGNNP